MASHIVMKCEKVESDCPEYSSSIPICSTAKVTHLIGASAVKMESECLRCLTWYVDKTRIKQYSLRTKTQVLLILRTFFAKLRQSKLEEGPEQALGAMTFSIEVNHGTKLNKESSVLTIDEETKLANRWTCEVCGKVFKWQSHLKKHFLIHSGEKPFMCILCEKSFSQSGSLKTHLLKHTGVRPYECKVCEKTFTESGKLNIHMLTHTGEKRFSCTICSRRFPTIGNLKKHAIVHTGAKPYVCKECGKGFGKNDTLKKHMTTHTGEKPYTCEVCKRCFGFRSAYKRHVQIHLEKQMDQMIS